MFDGPGGQVSDPRELLLGYLDWYREALIRKLAGLSEEQLRTPVEPLIWSPLGLVKHLTGVERRWLCWGFMAEDVLAWPPEGQDAEFNVTTAESTEDVFAAFHRQLEKSRKVTADNTLTAESTVGGRFATTETAPSLGRILFHLLQEYARHLGHLDIARELIDGTTGE